jgi:pimeloyl-ACP methyl ester carboxylesterase
MPIAHANGIDLCYETFGDGSDPAVLLVSGYTSQLLGWDEQFCAELAGRGRFVIRFDNRDVGLSTRFDGQTVDLAAVLAASMGHGEMPSVPYTLSAFSDDSFGLLDHLGIDAAHVVGVSMGGMIAQTMAIGHPERVRSLTSLMSTTGKRTVGWQHPTLLPNFLGRRAGRAGYIEMSVRTWKIIGSPGYPTTEERTRARAGETYDRGVTASGTLRQMMAILTQPNRSPKLRALKMPTLVVHGLGDKMVHVSGGRATAAAIHGAELLLIDGMGHDLPPALFETFADGIRRTASRAR